MLNQHDTHSNLNPIYDEERNEPSYESILASLSNEQQHIIEEYILELIAQAKRPVMKAKGLQREIDRLQNKLEDLNLYTWGGTEAEYNAEYRKIYGLKCDAETKLRNLILNTK